MKRQKRVIMVWDEYKGRTGEIDEGEGGGGGDVRWLTGGAKLLYHNETLRPEVLGWRLRELTARSAKRGRETRLRGWPFVQQALLNGVCSFSVGKVRCWKKLIEASKVRLPR